MMGRDGQRGGGYQRTARPVVRQVVYVAVISRMTSVGLRSAGPSSVRRLVRCFSTLVSHVRCDQKGKQLRYLDLATWRRGPYEEIYHDTGTTVNITWAGGVRICGRSGRSVRGEGILRNTSDTSGGL
jgi:hypothetical protein